MRQIKSNFRSKVTTFEKGLIRVFDILMLPIYNDIDYCLRQVRNLHKL